MGSNVVDVCVTVLDAVDDVALRVEVTLVKVVVMDEAVLVLVAEVVVKVLVVEVRVVTVVCVTEVWVAVCVVRSTLCMLKKATLILDDASSRLTLAVSPTEAEDTMPMVSSVSAGATIT